MAGVHLPAESPRLGGAHDPLTGLSHVQLTAHKLQLLMMKLRCAEGIGCMASASLTDAPWLAPRAGLQ